VPGKVKRTAPIAAAPAKTSKWRARAGLAAIALVAYANSFGLGLAQDANTIVGQDARLRAVTADNLNLILTKNYWWPLGGDGLYRPVTTLSFLFNYSVLGNGANAAGYHAVNFLLHAVNVWLLYELALLLFRRAGPAFFAAALWAVHPVDTEAVTSVVGRADLLAAMAVLGGLLLYVRSRSRWAPAALFAIACAGVFAKENAAVLPGLMLLWDVSFGEKPRWRSYAAAGASLAVLAAVRYSVLGGLPPYNPIYVDNPLRLAGFWTARFTAIKIVGMDLGLLLLPLTLVCDHSYDAVALASASDTHARLALLAAIAILAIVILRRRQDRIAFWAAGFFGITLLPTSNLLFLIGAPVAERFLYLPALAFTVIVVALLYRLGNDRIVKWVLIAIVAAYAVRTIARNPAWDSDLSLASADLPHAQRSFRLHYMMARALFQQDALGNIDQVIAEDEAACLILSSLPPARSIEFPPAYLGTYYALKADLAGPAQRNQWLEKSLASLLKAREISQAMEKSYDEVQRAHGSLTARSGDPQLYFFLAQTYTKLGRYNGAVDALRYARSLNPSRLEIYDGLAAAYSAIGDFPMALNSVAEKALVDHFDAATMRALRDLYPKLADGQCAFVASGAGWQLNASGCPRVKGDFCAAYAGLEQAYRDARVPQAAVQLQVAAMQRFGCPVQ
jgi:tetratricopeptide (TPR) repeat protein